MIEFDKNSEFYNLEESNNTIDFENIILYWNTMSDNDFDTMIDLYTMKRNNWALFIGHLVIEKLLKAIYVKNNKKHPPLVHDLLKIALKASLNLDNDKKLFLDTITTFNINARYDDFKLAFYKKCTNEYTQEWIENIKNLRLWIKQELMK